MLYIRCRCDLSPLLSPENQPAFSPSRESDPDHKSEIHALELRDYIPRIIAFVATSSDLSIRSPVGTDAPTLLLANRYRPVD
jgi:hypothetical protein